MEGSAIRWYGRKRSYKPWFVAAFLVISFFILGIFIGAGNDNNQRGNYFPLISSIYQLNFFADTHKSMLNMAVPVLGITSGHSQNIYSSGDKFFQRVISNVTSIDLANPKTFLGSEMVFMQTFEMEGRDIVLSESPGITEYERNFFEELERRNREAINSQTGEATFGDKPLVLIYNTHNSETFLPTDGVKLMPGTNSGVETVAAHLEKILLERHGIQSIRSTEIHDYPSWARAYINSERTAKNLLRENPSVQIVLDIHRDAGLPHKGVITTSTGYNMAKILLIVGSDTRLPHPTWRRNLEFAQMLGRKMDEIYPGLLKAVRVQGGRYNQHLHERSILVEVGCYQNTLEEALLSAEALADVVKEVLIALRQENTF
jgi:stage II sporulation protein P